MMAEAVARLPDHPLRAALAGEVHARPYEVLEPPVRASHLAVMAAGPPGAGRAALDDLCDRFGVAPPAAGAIHFAQSFGAFRLRWERHTEFCSWTFYRFDAWEDRGAFAATALDLVPADWLAAMPGAVLVAIHAVVRPGDAPPDVVGLFGDHLVVGSRVGAGAGAAWCDFRIRPDGFERLVINAGGLTRGQIGRTLQRLLELETYRTLALLAFPVAREMAPDLARRETLVSEITTAMAANGRAGRPAEADDRALLHRLIDVAAEVEGDLATHGYRFGAARAYTTLVWRAIEELREERIPGSQTYHEFMDRRFGPAMRTVEAMAERAEALGRRIARAAALLRTRVDITLEENNRDLLASMNRRADMQLRLQETVEGLSVVAISYYLWSLVAYLLKGAKAAGLPVSPEIASLVAIPVVLALVWTGVKRLKKAVGKGDRDDHATG
jgi:uncharacterized membrane-anchored protein